MTGLNIGAPPLEDAQKDVYLAIQVGPMQDEPAQVPSVGTRGMEPVIEPVRGFDPLGSSLEVILEDGLERVLL